MKPKICLLYTSDAADEAFMKPKIFITFAPLKHSVNS